MSCWPPLAFGSRLLGGLLATLSLLTLICVLYYAVEDGTFLPPGPKRSARLPVHTTALVATLLLLTHWRMPSPPQRYPSAAHGNLYIDAVYHCLLKLSAALLVAFWLALPPSAAGLTLITVLTVVLLMLLLGKVATFVTSELSFPRVTGGGRQHRSNKEVRFHSWVHHLSLFAFALALLTHLILLQLVAASTAPRWTEVMLPFLASALIHAALVAVLTIRAALFQSPRHPSPHVKCQILTAHLHAAMYVLASAFVVQQARVVDGQATGGKWSCVGWLSPFLLFAAGASLWHGQYLLTALHGWVARRRAVDPSSAPSPAAATTSSGALRSPHGGPPDEESLDEGSVTSADPACTVCCTRAVAAALLPCGHTGTCETCARRMRRDGAGCPFCRGPITGVLHLFFVNCTAPASRKGSEPLGLPPSSPSDRYRPASVQSLEIVQALDPFSAARRSPRLDRHQGSPLGPPTRAWTTPMHAELVRARELAAASDSGTPAPPGVPHGVSPRSSTFAVPYSPPAGRIRSLRLLAPDTPPPPTPDVRIFLGALRDSPRSSGERLDCNVPEAESHASPPHSPDAIRPPRGW